MKNENIDLEFAQFDCPINQLFVTIYLPEASNYGEFYGNLKETPFFSTHSKTRMNIPGFNDGISFSFEKFIVPEKEIFQLNVQYKEIVKGFFEKRRILC